MVVKMEVPFIINYMEGSLISTASLYGLLSTLGCKKSLCSSTCDLRASSLTRFSHYIS